MAPGRINSIARPAMENITPNNSTDSNIIPNSFQSTPSTALYVSIKPRPSTINAAPIINITNAPLIIFSSNFPARYVNAINPPIVNAITMNCFKFIFFVAQNKIPIDKPNTVTPSAIQDNVLAPFSISSECLDAYSKICVKTKTQALNTSAPSNDFHPFNSHIPTNIKAIKQPNAVPNAICLIFLLPFSMASSSTSASLVNMFIRPLPDNLLPNNNQSRTLTPNNAGTAKTGINESSITIPFILAMNLNIFSTSLSSPIFFISFWVLSYISSIFLSFKFAVNKSLKESFFNLLIISINDDNLLIFSLLFSPSNKTFSISFGSFISIFWSFVPASFDMVEYIPPNISAIVFKITLPSANSFFNDVSILVKATFMLSILCFSSVSYMSLLSINSFCALTILMVFARFSFNVLILLVCSSIFSSTVSVRLFTSSPLISFFKDSSILLVFSSKSLLIHSILDAILLRTLLSGIYYKIFFIIYLWVKKM